MPKSPENGAPAVSIRNFSWRYEGARELTLRDTSLTVQRGECVVVTGASGCGKSTLTYAINGLIPHFHEGAYSGEVHVCGVDALRSPTYELARCVGSVFQDPRSQFFATTTDDEVAFGCENLGLDAGEIARRSSASFAAMRADELRERDIFGLSSGQKQKIAIASVLAMEPELVVMDEPSANLDNEACAMLAACIARIKASGRTVIVAEHRLSYLMDIADRIVIMEEGRVSEQMDASCARTMPYAQARARGLRAADIALVPLPRDADDAEREHTAGKTTNPAGAAEQVRESPSDPVRAAHLEAAPAPHVKASGIAAGYKSSRVLERVDFTCARPREVTTIIGRNGAGKTTLARVLCGLKKETGGTVSIEGATTTPRERQRACAFVMQDADYQLFTESVDAEMRFARKPSPGFDARISETLSHMGLNALRDAHPMTLSGGQKQRLTIACALTSEARVVLFDEPTSGLDGANMREVAHLMRSMAEQGRRVLVITHDFEFVAAACDRALCVQDGIIARDLSVSECNRALLLEHLGISSSDRSGTATPSPFSETPESKILRE